MVKIFTAKRQRKKLNGDEMSRFMGKYSHTVDDKGRAFVPSKFRDGLGNEFVVCKGFHEKCLYMFPYAVFDSLAEKLSGESLFDESIAKVQREFYSNSAPVELDKQGRIVIPQDLRDYADIKKEVVIAGAGTRVEIWDKSTLDENHDPQGMKAALRNIRAQGKSI